jgi:hypothetical protein
MADKEPQAKPAFTGGRPRPAVDPDTIVVKPKGPSGFGRPRPAAGAVEQPPSKDSGGESSGGAPVTVAPGDDAWLDDGDGDESDIPGQVTLKSGDAGPEVEAWQTVCNEMLLGDDDGGFGDPDGLFLTVDGHFGSETRNTTLAVQYVLGLATTGDVDEATWYAVLGA